MKITLETVARLAGLGAYGACAGLGALIGGVVFLAAPTKLGGIDGINAAVTAISFGGLLFALIVAHLVIGKQLIRLSKGKDKRHPL